MEAFITSMLIKWALEGHAYQFGLALVLMGIAYLAMRQLWKESYKALSENTDKLTVEFREAYKGISQHLINVEQNLKDLSASVDGVKKSLVTLEVNHSREIYELKKEVKLLDEEVKKLKVNK